MRTACETQSVVASWAKSGILRECFNQIVLHRAGKKTGQVVVPVIDEMKEIVSVSGNFVAEDEPI